MVNIILILAETFDIIDLKYLNKRIPNVEINTDFTVMPHERHGDSYQWRVDCLFKDLFKLTQNEYDKTWNIRITDQLWGDSSDHWWIPRIKG